MASPGPASWSAARSPRQSRTLPIRTGRAPEGRTAGGRDASGTIAGGRVAAGRVAMPYRTLRRCRGIADPPPRLVASSGHATPHRPARSPPQRPGCARPAEGAIGLATQPEGKALVGAWRLAMLYVGHAWPTRRSPLAGSARVGPRTRWRRDGARSGPKDSAGPLAPSAQGYPASRAREGTGNNSLSYPP